MSVRSIMLIMAFCLSCPLHAAPVLIFESAADPRSELHNSLYKAISSALKSEGYQLKTVGLPAKRGLQDLKAGRVDGSLGRIGDMAALLGADDLVRVDVPLAVFTISRWCRKDPHKPTQALKVGTRLGTVVLMMLKKHLDLVNIDLQETAHQKSLLQMLKAGRIDCMLSNDFLMEAEGIKMKELEKFDRFDFVSLEVYPWLSKKHISIKTNLENSLRAYPFTPAFRKKFLDVKPACEGKLNRLCPDGLIVKSKADLG